MSREQPSRLLPRRGLVVLGSGLAGPGVALLVTEPLTVLLRAVQHRPTELTLLPVEDVVAGACAAALLTAYVLWLLGLLVALTEAGSPRVAALARRVPCPAIARTVAASALGVAVVVTAAPAGADPGPDARRSAVVTSTVDALAGLLLPDRVATQPTGRSAPEGRVHEVVAGDTLWDIAADELPSTASAAQVERAWRRVAAANRDVVDDPHLIFPGTHLRVPPLNASLGEDQP